MRLVRDVGPSISMPPALLSQVVHKHTHSFSFQSVLPLKNSGFPNSWCPPDLSSRLAGVVLRLCGLEEAPTDFDEHFGKVSEDSRDECGSLC